MCRTTFHPAAPQETPEPPAKKQKKDAGAKDSKALKCVFCGIVYEASWLHVSVGVFKHVCIESMCKKYK